MRNLLLALVLAGSTALVGLTPTQADAAWWNRPWRAGYWSGYYYPSSSYYYGPAIMTSYYYTPAYTTSYYYTPAYTTSYYYTPAYTTSYSPGYTSYYYNPRYYVWP